MKHPRLTGLYQGSAYDAESISLSLRTNDGTFYLELDAYNRYHFSFKAAGSQEPAVIADGQAFPGKVVPS